MKYWFATIFAVSLVVFVVWLEVRTWNECLDSNTFWYCLRVLDK